MEVLALKVKLSVLWLIYIVKGLTLGLFGLLEPGVIQDIIEKGEMGGMQLTPELFLVMAVILLVPLVMAFLSLTLKDSTNRWANIILGIVFTGLGFVELIEYVAMQSAYGVLLEIVGVVFSALIVWYAYKWPKKEG